MAEKSLNTRIQLRYDTLSNWQTKNTLLKSGELAIVEIEIADPANKQNPPVMFKVGPGNFNDLEWASALAADVYAWAKKPTLDANDLPEIPGAKFGLTVTVTGNGNAITDAFWDEISKTLTLTKGTTFKTAQQPYSAGGGVTQTITGVTQDANGKINVTYTNIEFPTVADTEVAGEIVTEVKQNDGAITVSRKAIEVVHENGLIYLTIDNKKIGEGFSDADFIKDGFLQSVTKDTDNNTITFTWNTDAGITTTVIDIDDLVEAYTASDGIDITEYVVKIKDSGVTTAKIAAKAVTEAKLADEVTAKLNKEWQPAGDYKTVQTAVTDPTASGKSLTFIDTISQNTNGVITATKKNVNLDSYALKSEIPTDFGVTSITAGDGLDGGTITKSGTIALSAATKASLALANTALQDASAFDAAGSAAAALDAAKAYADANDADTTYTAAANGGLKLTGTEFAIDDSITFIFNCGGAE